MHSIIIIRVLSIFILKNIVKFYLIYYLKFNIEKVNRLLYKQKNKQLT